MLPDGDAGCLITAAQSGAQWGYRLILPQLVLIPVLYLVQEMTVRLGVHTGLGHGALIRREFGRGWAMVSAVPMIISAIGTLVVEFVGVAGVGELFGISRWVTVPTATVFLIGLGFSRGYRRVERIGIAVGLAELAFVPAMLLARPKIGAIASQLGSQPVGHSSYLTLLAATVGAVIMPWMIFYQQGAVVDARIKPGGLRHARRDTLAGAILIQFIMIVVIVTLATTVGRTNPNQPLTSVGEPAADLRRPDRVRGGAVPRPHPGKDPHRCRDPRRRAGLRAGCLGSRLVGPGRGVRLQAQPQLTARARQRQVLRHLRAGQQTGSGPYARRPLPGPAR